MLAIHIPLGDEVGQGISVPTFGFPRLVLRCEIDTRREKRRQMNILSCAYRSDAGNEREDNEDFVYVDKSLGLFVVADGMGGQPGGGEASTTAVKTLVTLLKECLGTNASINKATIQDVIQKVNQSVCRKSSTHPRLKGMGTTLVMALFRNTSLTVAHVGDSRAYLIRNKQLKPLTRDHTAVETMIQKGIITREKARHHELRHIVTSFIGMETSVVPDVVKVPVRSKDWLLLCSDGLTEMLTDEEIEAIVNAGSKSEEICNSMIDSVNEKGGYDNVTVVLTQFT